MSITFGTEGWRGVIARDFTHANVDLVARALARYLKKVGALHELPLPRGENPRPLLLVGYDTRFGSPEFARTAAQALLEEGYQVKLSPAPIPSPLLSFAVKHYGARGGVMITASHNPPQYNGLKFKDHFGGSAAPAVTDAIEREIQILQQEPYQVGAIHELPLQKNETFNSFTPYYQHVQELVDFKSLKKSGLTVVVDPMHGAGSGWMKKLLNPWGVKMIEIASKRDPFFGGRNPEPIEENLGPLIKRIRHLAGRKKLGLGLDGDADRLGAVDEKGGFINSHQIFALLLQHLVEHKGWKGAVVKTFSTTDMVDKLCRRYSLPLKTVPIGFKYICQLMLEEKILMGGEESGGLGFAHHIPERDGLLAGLFLLEFLAQKGKTLGQAVEDLYKRVGPHAYQRWDLPLASPVAGQEAVARLKSRPPAALGGHKVAKYEDLDGFKLRFKGGGWLLYRASGTEPVLRLYAEGPDLAAVRDWLEEGKKLILGSKQ